ncbi:MAG: hypothetical protein AB7O38_14820, partial [Pirellulaceae bacterium]
SETDARMIYIEANGTSVIRLRGTPQDLGLANMARQEGEFTPPQDIRDYQRSVDAALADAEFGMA